MKLQTLVAFVALAPALSVTGASWASGYNCGCPSVRHHAVHHHVAHVESYYRSSYGVAFAPPVYYPTYYAPAPVFAPPAWYYGYRFGPVGWGYHPYWGGYYGGGHVGIGGWGGWGGWGRHGHWGH